MQNTDRPADIQALSLPAGHRGSRVDPNAVRIILRAHGVAGIRSDCSGRRYVGQHSPVRPPEAQLTLRLSFYLVAFLVHRAMVSPA